MTSTKSQTISKYQFSNVLNYLVQWVLVISILKLVLIWNLVLDAWNFNRSAGTHASIQCSLRRITQRDHRRGPVILSGKTRM